MDFIAGCLIHQCFGSSCLSRNVGACSQLSMCASDLLRSAFANSSSDEEAASPARCCGAPASALGAMLQRTFESESSMSEPPARAADQQPLPPEAPHAKRVRRTREDRRKTRTSHAAKSVVAAYRQSIESTGDAVEAEATLSEKRRAAAQERWKKVRTCEKFKGKVKGQNDVETASSQDFAKQLQNGELQIVPADKEESLANVTESSAIVAVRPNPSQFKAKDLKTEQFLLANSRRLMSNTALAVATHLSSPTITRKRRVLACLLVLMKRVRCHELLKRFHLALLATVEDPTEVEAYSFVCRYKYDEFSLKLRVQEMMSGKPQPVIAKLLQITVMWSALFRRGEEFTQLNVPYPTTLRCMEKNDSSHLVNTVSSETTVPEWVKSTFTHKTRMPICDDAAQNNVADHAMFREWPDEVLSRWICDAHKEHKTGQFMSQAFKQDTRGLLHFCLGFRYAGAGRTFIQALKLWMKPRLRCYDAASSEQEPAATLHREKVFAQ